MVVPPFIEIPYRGFVIQWVGVERDLDEMIDDKVEFYREAGDSFLMKNIIIVGSSRAGKTTLAKRLRWRINLYGFTRFVKGGESSRHHFGRRVVCVLNHSNSLNSCYCSHSRCSLFCA